MNPIFNLSQLALITVTGERAQTFLQGQLTCDVREVTEQLSRRGAHCNHKGRILTSLRIIYYQQRYYLLLPAIMVEPTLKELKKYAQLARVELEKSTQLAMFGCYGEEISAELNELFPHLPESADAVQQENGLLILRVCNSQLRYLVLGTDEAILKLRQQLSSKFAIAADSAWQLLDIQAGIADIYPETANLFTPQMLNYPELNAVSFKKGCYIGQEVIARTHYLGKAKRHLRLGVLHSSTPPPLGAALYKEESAEEIGLVVAATCNASGECQILAVIKDDALDNAISWQGQEIALSS